MHFVSALLMGLLAFLGEALTRWLLSLGAGFVVYQGADLMMDQLIAKTQELWNGLPSHILQIMALAGVNEAISIGLSGVVFHITMSFVNRRVMSFRSAQ
ncbi:DUF2523 domain-containing protein [Oceanimonas marisflavi]|uniref:DUF2523 domain-containing protein n=1 Tax=Oceanimonas marisflavi TaxID=2059724 RepID=UPI000D2FC688|nr:DUF2523 domain-containing protein [Oceanimonas marisflavi]